MSTGAQEHKSTGEHMSKDKKQERKKQITVSYYAHM